MVLNKCILFTVNIAITQGHHYMIQEHPLWIMKFPDRLHSMHEWGVSMKLVVTFSGEFIYKVYFIEIQNLFHSRT